MSNHEWDVQLVEELTELADAKNPNRAAMAHLRRGLDGSLDHALARVGWLFRRVPDFALEDAVLAAALFAWIRGSCPHQHRINFGAAFGAGLTLEEKQRREKRFIDLLDTDKQDLPYKLRQAITLIGGDGSKVALDWVLLIKHLGHWNHQDRWVQKEWARGFWTTTAEDETLPVAVKTESTTE